MGLTHISHKLEGLQVQRCRGAEGKELVQEPSSAPLLPCSRAKDFERCGEKSGVDNSGKPSQREIKEICTELKRLRINPQACLGVIKKYWGNVQGAIARL